MSSMELHLAGKQHKKKLTGGSGWGGSDKKAKDADAAAAGAAQQQLPPGAYRCEICNISTTDEAGLAMHMNGRKHQKQLIHMGYGYY